jgi:hypothetical protein
MRRKFFSTVLPIARSRLVAPTTSTDVGVINEARDALTFNLSGRDETGVLR